MAKHKQKLWRSKIVVEILSRGTTPPKKDDLSLINMADECLTGDWSGQTTVGGQDELNPQEMADALIAQGSAPAFFELNEDGTPLAEEDS